MRDSLYGRLNCIFLFGKSWLKRRATLSPASLRLSARRSGLEAAGEIVASRSRSAILSKLDRAASDENESDDENCDDKCKLRSWAFSRCDTCAGAKPAAPATAARMRTTARVMWKGRLGASELRISSTKPRARRKAFSCKCCFQERCRGARSALEERLFPPSVA